MSTDDEQAPDHRHPGLARGEDLAAGLTPAGDEEVAAEQARHPRLARGGEGLAQDGAADEDTARAAVEQARHPGGPRGEELADDAP